MLSRKAKNGKGGSAQFFPNPLGDFRHLLKITLPPSVRNPETAPGFYPFLLGPIKVMTINAE